jgi:hypothetical protein
VSQKTLLTAKCGVFETLCNNVCVLFVSGSISFDLRMIFLNILIVAALEAMNELVDATVSSIDVALEQLAEARSAVSDSKVLTISDVNQDVFDHDEQGHCCGVSRTQLVDAIEDAVETPEPVHETDSAQLQAVLTSAQEDSSTLLLLSINPTAAAPDASEGAVRVASDSVDSDVPVARDALVLDTVECDQQPASDVSDAVSGAYVDSAAADDNSGDAQAADSLLPVLLSSSVDANSAAPSPAEDVHESGNSIEAEAEAHVITEVQSSENIYDGIAVDDEPSFESDRVHVDVADVEEVPLSDSFENGQERELNEIIPELPSTTTVVNVHHTEAFEAEEEPDMMGHTLEDSPSSSEASRSEALLVDDSGNISVQSVPTKAVYSDSLVDASGQSTSVDPESAPASTDQSALAPVTERPLQDVDDDATIQQSIDEDTVAAVPQLSEPTVEQDQLDDVMLPTFTELAASAAWVAKELFVLSPLFALHATILYSVAQLPMLLFHHLGTASYRRRVAYKALAVIVTVGATGFWWHHTAFWMYAGAIVLFVVVMFQL